MEPAWNITGILTQLTSDFLLPHADISKGRYTAAELKALWNPVLTDSTEERIETHSGFINVTHGGNQAGKAIILWPSLMMRGSMWSHQYEHFRNKYRVVMIDSPGINKSDPLRKYIDLKDCARIVIDIMDALKIDRCIFGGNSWGAMLAAVIPAYYPNRLLGSIVINGTASLPSTLESIMMTVRTEALMLNETVPDWWVAIAKGAFCGVSAETSNPSFVAYCGAPSQEDPKSIAWALRTILIGRVDTHATLRSIKDIPVLVIAGGEDRQFGIATCKTMADAIPTSKFVVAEGAAHLAARERPDLVNGMIDSWLSEVGLA